MTQVINQKFKKFLLSLTDDELQELGLQRVEIQDNEPQSYCDLDLIISDSLQKFGISEDLRGYDYLVYAIRLVIEDRNRIFAICKEVYISVAEKYGTTATRAERCIRTAIQNGYVQGNSKLYSEVFPSNGGNAVPTNGTFIARIARNIQNSL